MYYFWVLVLQTVQTFWDGELILHDDTVAVQNKSWLLWLWLCSLSWYSSSWVVWLQSWDCLCPYACNTMGISKMWLFVGGVILILDSIAAVILICITYLFCLCFYFRRENCSKIWLHYYGTRSALLLHCYRYANACHNIFLV